MKNYFFTLAMFLPALSLLADQPSQQPQSPSTASSKQLPRAKPVPNNPSIDMAGFMANAKEAAKHRETRRVSEADFLKMSHEKGTIILDARSKEKFDLLHISDAINLSFPDMTVESLKKVLPNKEATILIYCNNNFKNAELAFPTKMPAASLNLSTYLTLYNYGYRNVYELAPLLDPKKTVLSLVSTPKK